MILLALGSNLGDREANLAAARGALVGYDIHITAVSSIYETLALMPENAPDDWDIPYLNQVIAVDTHHGPETILVCIKHIEQELGRMPAERWAPRELDIDILAVNDWVMVTDYLTLPHPAMDTRRFVLEPLAEIAPEWLHPVLKKTAREMLAELPA